MEKSTNHARGATPKVRLRLRFQIRSTAIADPTVANRNHVFPHSICLLCTLWIGLCLILKSITIDNADHVVFFEYIVLINTIT